MFKSALVELVALLPVRERRRDYHASASNPIALCRMEYYYQAQELQAAAGQDRQQQRERKVLPQQLQRHLCVARFHVSALVLTLSLARLAHQVARRLALSATKPRGVHQAFRYRVELAAAVQHQQILPVVQSQAADGFPPSLVALQRYADKMAFTVQCLSVPVAALVAVHQTLQRVGPVAMAQLVAAVAAAVLA
jgi:hypothetical protein